MALNLEKQLLFYGSYHHNPVNIAIHVTCVPLILMTAILLATNLKPVVTPPEYLAVKNLPLNPGTIVGLIYTILYILMEPVAGGILAPFLIAGTAFVNHLSSTYGTVANNWAIGIQIVTWVAQFIGHGVFEGRAPALLDNLVQALFLAPLFVWIEVLFFFGYRSELKARLEKAIEREIAKFRGSKGGSKKENAAQGEANTHD